jgi:dimethylargininase
MFKYAITRKPGRNFAEGLTTANLGKPEYDRIIVQHQAYINTLRELGLEVTVLDPLPDYPDAYFVEDVAVIAPEVAVLTNPGADSRKGEVAHIESALNQFRKIEKVTGALEGGDVMCVEDHYYIGISPRTSEDGADQLGRILEKYGHTWSTVPVVKHIHLKTSVNYLGQNT